MIREAFGLTESRNADPRLAMFGAAAYYAQKEGLDPASVIALQAEWEGKSE